MYDEAFFRSIDDPRGSLDDYPDPRQWRIEVRKKLYKDRKGRSCLTATPLAYSFDLHEGIFSRRWVGKQDWQQWLYSGPNLFILSMSEHIPQPPSRIEAFWISVARYGMDNVQRYIDSLPFKVRPSTPWSGTHGLDIISKIPDTRKVDTVWYSWFLTAYERLDNVA